MTKGELEKEAEDSFNCKKVLYKWETDKRSYIDGFKDGAEFGYNKANEWHYVKDGDLPKDNEYIIIYSKLADNIAVGKRRCAGKVRRRCVYEWYFATYEGTYCLRDKDIIAWKEIVLPELPKEIEENDSKRI